MTSVIPVQFFGEEDKSSQKCIIPLHLFERTNLKLGEYVCLKTSRNDYICCVYTTTEPLAFIFVDDTVSFTNSFVYNRKAHKESMTFPDSVNSLKASQFDHINVKILLNENCTLNCDKATYENIIRKLLSHYVLRADFIVNCSGSKLADFFHIHGILILETFPKETFGRLIKTTHVEITDVSSWEQLKQIDTLRNLELGGMQDSMNMLKFNLIPSFKPHTVLVSGPSGCGKSSLVKKFCYHACCFYVMLDGLNIIDLTMDKLNMHCEMFSSYLKIFPNNSCLFFIDHIDVIALYGSKQRLYTVSMLVSLIHRLKELGVNIIATAVHKRSVNSKVASLFDREINLGLPSLRERKEIFKVLTKSCNSQLDYDKVAQMTPGFVGHDITLLIKEAISISLKRKSNEKTDMSPLTMEDVENGLASVSPSILKSSIWNMKVKPIYWKDIGGMFHVKKRLQMCIEWPLQNPDVFKKVDLPCPHGVLLFGPPGCCKTTLARGLATECSANFFAANPAQIYSPYVGESEKNITELFYQARLCAPSIIFLDELDSLVNKRKLDRKSQGIGEKVLSTLLNEMDGFGTKMLFHNNVIAHKLLNNNETTEYTNDKMKEERCSNDDVIVIAATNRPDLIDDALLRPGRFDVILYVPPPNLEERESILQTLTHDIPIQDVDFKKLARNTDLFSGADLKNLCNEAAMNALRNDISTSQITEKYFDDAMKKIQPSITRQQIQKYEKLSSKYGTVIKNI